MDKETREMFNMIISEIDKLGEKMVGIGGKTQKKRAFSVAVR